LFGPRGCDDRIGAFHREDAANRVPLAALQTLPVIVQFAGAADHAQVPLLLE